MCKGIKNDAKGNDPFASNTERMRYWAHPWAKPKNQLFSLSLNTKSPIFNNLALISDWL